MITRLLLAVFLSLFCSFTSQAGKVVKRGPEQQPTTHFCDLCRTGEWGVGWDPVTETYSETCGGLRPWSTKYGGTDADDVGDWDTPLNTLGNAEWGECDGDGYGHLDDGTAISPVESCLYDGERFKLHMMADAMIAQEMTRPGGTIHFCIAPGYNQTLYENDACGARRDGETPTGRVDATNPCPVLKFPQDTRPQRWLQRRAGYKWIWEGRDPDGLDEPKDADADKHQTGAILVGNTGMRAGCRSGTCNFDDNGDNSQYLYGHVSYGGDADRSNECIPVSATDPRCDSAANVNSNGIRVQLFGNDSTMVTMGSLRKLCIDDDPSTTGTCAVDRRVACTTAREYCVGNGDPWACCDAAYPGDDGSCDDRVTATTGGCDFGVTGGDLGPCEGWVTAMEAETITGEHNNGELRRLTVGLESRACDLKGIYCGVGNSVNYGTISKVEDASCGIRERLVSFDTFPGGVYQAWPLEMPFLEDYDSECVGNHDPWYCCSDVGVGSCTGTNFVFTVDDDVRNDIGGGDYGGTIRNGSWYPRIAGDNQVEGEADDSDVGPSVHDGTHMYVLTGTFTADEWNYCTLILRDDQQWEHDGCGANCKEAREITDTTTTSIVVGTAFDDIPVDADSYHVSCASCVGATAGGATGEDACDSGDSIMVFPSSGGEIADKNLYWVGQINDDGGGSDHFKMQRLYIKDHRMGYLSDMSEAFFRDIVIENVSSVGSTLMRIGFGGHVDMENITIRNSSGTIIGLGHARQSSFRNLRFDNITTSGLIAIQTAVMATFDGIFTTGIRGPIFLINPQTNETVTGLTIRNGKFLGGFSNTGYGSVLPLAPIVISDNAGNASYQGDIEAISIETVYAIIDPDATGVAEPMLVGLEFPPTSTAAFAQHYNQLIIKDSGVRRAVRNEACIDNNDPWSCCSGLGTGTCVLAQVSCGYDSSGGLGNVGCENAGVYPASEFIELDGYCVDVDDPWDCCTGAGTGACDAPPPVMVNNHMADRPAGDQPYQWAYATDLDHLDCDDIGYVEVAVIDDDGACADTNGVLDGGNTTPTRCACIAGTWTAID